MSADYKLLDAYDKIGSTRATERGNGLIDLKRLLMRKQNAKHLNDKGWHKMYEIVFKAAVSERNIYTKQSKATLRKATENRLQTCGSVLRAAVELGVEHLRIKTVRAVFRHIIDILPVAGGGLCEPISMDYVKALRVLFEYAPHTEHLLPEEWEQIGRFCCTHVRAQLGLLDEDEDEDTEAQTQLRRETMLAHDDSSMSRRSILAVPQKRLSHESEELMMCLRNLSAAPNAPIISHATMICDMLLGFFRAQASYTRAHQHAFSSLNFVLNVITTNDIALVSRICDEVVPTISRIWDTKMPALRDEMIIFLIHTRAHIRARIKTPKGRYLRTSVENLFDSLCNEYIVRSDRELLQLDDMVFPSLGRKYCSEDLLSLRTIALRPNPQNFRAEQAWMIPSLIAALVEMLDMSGFVDKRARQNGRDDESEPKRQRMYDRADEIMRFARSTNSPRKLLALQVVPFLVEIHGVNEKEFQSIIQDLYEASSDDNPAIASWALVSVASCSFLKCASSPANSKLWNQVWQLCARYATNQPTCRIACHVMRILISHGLVAYASVSKDIDSMLQSIDVNGPAVLCDSSTALWRLLLERRSTTVHSNRFQPGERLFQWFASKWRPVEEGMEKASATSYAHLTSPIDIVLFVSACCGVESILVETYPQKLRGPVGQACIRSARYRKLEKMLLHEEDMATVEDLQEHPDARSNGAISPSPMQQAQVIDFLERQAGFMHDKWRAISGQKQGVNGAVMQNFTAFILIAGALCFAMSRTNSRSGELESKIRSSLLEDLIRFLSSDECSQKQKDGLYFALQGFLPKASAVVFGAIFQTLVEKENATASLEDSSKRDAMDIDDGFGFPDHDREEEKKRECLFREEVETLHSEDTFRTCSKALLSLFTLATKNPEPTDLCGQFAVHLMQTSKHHLLTMRPVIVDYLEAACHEFVDEDAVNLYEHLAVELLQGYDLERCEISVALCMDAIAALASRWVLGTENTEVVDTCQMVFDHVIKAGIDKQVTSYSIRSQIATLLECILEAKPNYRKEHKQSPLSLYDRLLQDRDVRVIFFVTQRLRVLFKVMGESVHAKICEEIEAALPSDQDWTEGLAMRIHTLAFIAVVSPSNISRIVYRIFETGQIPGVENHAARALLTVAKSFGLISQRELFGFFGAKLIYTWTEHYDFKDFPFTVWGYSSLKAMCHDVSEELIAQLMAGNNEEGAGWVASTLGVRLNNLLVLAFPKVIAYGYAWAVGIPPKQGREPPKSLASRVQKHIGSDLFSELFSKHFPRIVSNIYLLMHEDGTAEKLLSKDAHMQDALQTFRDIAEQGYSSRKLKEALNPHFKVKFILNALHHVSSALKVEDDNLWTPAMVTFVARQLFNTLHPALGPMHTCGVIRNIRFLICLARERVHEGYPLQMLIHGLKPFVIEPVCAEDAIGIVRYLLVNGSDYLSKHPSFVIGAFLSILASLRGYLQATENAVQQDTQTLSTISTVRSFHSWLAEHLAAMHFAALKPEQNEAFQAIVASAIELKDYGNASQGTKESELLRQLLDDDRDPDKLLDDVSRVLAFSMLCSNFSRPASFRDDIFGTDDESFERSRSLLRICRRSGANDGFLLWSARVLGRAYASTGQLHLDWMREMEFDYPKDVVPTNTAIDLVPRVGILRRLKALLFSNDKAVVGLAETTLARVIYSETFVQENALNVVLADDEYAALQWTETPQNGQNAVIQPIAGLGNPGSSAVTVWIKNLTVSMCTNMADVPMIKALEEILRRVDGLSDELFPYITHVFLTQDLQISKGLREQLSAVFQMCFENCSASTVPHNTILIKTILYLRSQPMQRELTKARRDTWLDINYLDASQAACTCKMFKAALLFAEIHNYASNEEIPSVLLLEIFKNIDDPDSFYGVTQTFSLDTVMESFEYEGDGWKSLSLRGANLESDIRLGMSSGEESLGVINALNALGMNGLSHSFLQGGSFAASASGKTVDNTYRSAWKLEQWDLPCPTTYDTRSASIYRALQSVNNTMDSRSISLHVDPPFLDVMKRMVSDTQTGHTLCEGMRTLAMLTEMEEVLISNNPPQLDEAWERLQCRNIWMETGKYADVEEIMAMRQATFGSLAKREHLREATGVNEKKARYMEAKALVGCCKMARKHEVLQHALSAATQLNRVVDPCRKVGLDISGVATLQASNVLWEDGQGLPSIRMLQSLEGDPATSFQSMVVGRAKLLAKLGSRMSEARLEKPDKIMSQYLEKAIAELGHDDAGSEAGRVFHEFANFCDQQLQNPNNIEDYERALKLRQDKEAEVRELEKLIRAGAANKDSLNRECHKAKSWLALDDAEYTRLKENREAFLEKSVLNYLRCLAACDDYDGDAVRFSSLWLANSADDKINAAASILHKVASRKFVSLMNQLSSRLLNTADEFQRLLLDLIFKICQDHPYHGIYQILALSKTRTKDNVSVLRQAAAVRVTTNLQQSKRSEHVVLALDTTTRAYEKLALIKVEKKTQPRGGFTLKFVLKDSRERATKYERDIPSFRIPPPTMHIEVRADRDYSKLPMITRYDQGVVLASGLSVPKIIKCEASDGTVFKQLVKGGSDDLRQDAIMEQVFEQVSVLLQKGRITRQRNLKIRTYKVIPLSASNGIIEFVPNTIPLQEWLAPAHQNYHPKDWRQPYCRKVISDAQSKSREFRITEFQRVLRHYQPVMHYFFMHDFNGPDEWFSSRLAYTRSTAAISILGYVLGLGDRHGHNILLDTKTGEVVHIDLGVAFEQGRVLPVPEVVPFRLTRDTVDGMGITKMEGVFRRCCEFTLEVLRNEAYSITTILDVLRYDPLYSWSMSPLRMKRMQDNQFEQLQQPLATTKSLDGTTKPKDESESEADRALTVVAKKLSKTLSVGATVNELIQQASDEKNLALLFCGMMGCICIRGSSGWGKASFFIPFSSLFHIDIKRGNPYNVGLESDHRGINKFESTADPNYIKVLEKLRRLVDSAPDILRRGD